MSRARPKIQVQQTEARSTAGRSGLYSLLARALSVPDSDFHSWVTDGGLVSAISEISAELPYELPGPDLSDIELPAFVDFQSDYIGFFDVGMKSPPCPLYEGAFHKDRGRKGIMEDLVRFYHHFDLKMSDKMRELPDQLSAELEFMHYLTYLESGLAETPAGGDDDPRLDLARAQRDFISRHLMTWVPDLAKRAADRNGPLFYQRLLKFLESYIKAEQKYLEAILS